MNKYRSGLEVSIAKQLKKFRIKFDYEKLVILYTRPAQSSTYTPDFRLANGIIIETKGRFVVSDRKKHLLIRKQYGNKYDIRFVFSNAKQKFIKDQKQLMPIGASSMVLNFLTKQFRWNGSRRSMALIVLNALILSVLIFIAFMVFVIGRNLDEKK